MKALLAALALLATACTDLPDFGSGCGNLVLDEGEDCDGEPGCDATCSLTCTATTDCPDGYACGIDSVCHAPSGRFHLATSTLVSPGALTVTDVDRDGIDDLLAVTPTSLDMYAGDKAATFGTRSSTLVPHAQGAPAFTLLDTDAASDALVPTANGIAGYATQFKLMSPHTFPIDLQQETDCGGVDLGQPFDVFAMDDRFLGLFTAATLDGTPRLAFAVIDGAGKTACPAQQLVQVCDMAPPQISMQTPPDKRPVIDVYTHGQGGKVIAITDPTQGTCVIETKHINAGAGDGYTVTQLLPGHLPVTTRTVLATIRAGLCPSLIYGDASNMMELPGKGTPGSCGFDPAVRLALPGLPPGTTAVGHLRLEPSLGATYARDALMVSFGAFAFNAGVPELVYRSDRPLDTVQSADLDGDLDLDAVAAQTGVAGVDVLIRTGGTFLPLRIDTDPIALLELGDYDGNQASDIGYVEATGTGNERLMVSYGTRDRPLDPVAVGTFVSVVGLCRIQAADAADPDGLVDDLIVMDLPPDRPDRHEPVITLFHGSPQRTLTAFLDPRTDPDVQSVFTNVSAGNFFPDAGTPATDLIGIEVRDAFVMAWPFHGTTPGEVEFLDQPDYEKSGMVHCARALTATGAGMQAGPQPLDPDQALCIDNARFVTWPRADHDVVIALENPTEMVAKAPANRGVAVLDPTSFARDGVMAHVKKSGAGFDAIDKRLIATSLRVADVDGDAQPELIVGFGAAASVASPDLTNPLPPPKQTLALCTVDGEGMPTTCTTPQDDYPELAGFACFDAAPIHAWPRARGAFDSPPPDDGTSFAVGCVGPGGRSNVFLVRHDAAGFHWSEIFSDAHTIVRLVVGDINGDKVDDVLAVEDGFPFATLLAITQCTSHDAGDCPQ